MDYNKRQLVSVCNSILDEYFENETFGEQLQQKTMILLVHFIRSFYSDEELHESKLPMKGTFR